jgi:molybdenum cofactor synthesis domain-containing protein
VTTPTPTGQKPTARVLTVSDRRAAGLREDLSGPRLEARLRELGFEVLEREVVEDGEKPVATALRSLCHRGDTQLVLTTGGSGLALRDLTPEATRKVADRLVPGLMELARRRCCEITPLAALGRGIAAVVQRTLVVNLPGHPKAALETLNALSEVLPHALNMIASEADCEQTGRGGRNGKA